MGRIVGGGIRGSRRSGRRTSKRMTGWIWVVVPVTTWTTMLRHLRVRARIRWWMGGSMWFVVWPLATSFGIRTLHLGAWRRLLIHGLLIALWCRRILTGLLRRILLLVAIGVRWKRLAVCAVERLVRWCILAAIERMRGDECLGLSAHGREDALLREAHAVGAAPIFRLIETRAANLWKRQSITRCERWSVRVLDAYLASSTVATRDCSSLARRRLGWRVAAHVLRRIGRRIDWGQVAVWRWVHHRERLWLRLTWLRVGGKLFAILIVTVFSGLFRRKRGIDGVAAHLECARAGGMQCGVKRWW